MIRGMSAPSFMDLALKVAENAGKSGEVPIGCVIVRGYDVIATAGNRTLTDRDPTAHAEILAIRQAAEAIGTERLVDCDLYVTLEPCTHHVRRRDLLCPHPPAVLRRRRSQGRRGRVGRAVLRATDLPPRAGGLWRGRRERGGPPAARVLPGAAVGGIPAPARRCHHPRKRMIQYSRDRGDQSRSRGALDTRIRGYDRLACG